MLCSAHQPLHRAQAGAGGRQPLARRRCTASPGLALSACAALLAAAHALPTRAQTLASPPPNIIFILADDLGYGDLGCYGQQKIRTPNLDRMAAEGIRFTQCYAGSTVCAPSRAVLMTGLHTGHAKIRGNAAMPLGPDDVTVAAVVKSKGYRTAVFGKWGLGLEHTTGVPAKQGFDEWFGYLNQTLAHNYFPETLWRNDFLFQLDRNANGRKGDYSHDWFTRAATNFIATSTNGPFFLYLAYTIPHAHNKLTRETGNGMEVPHDAPYSSESWPQPERNKAAMITRLDRDVGQILHRLKALNLDHNTIVFFSSDNGPHKEGGNDPKFFNSSGPLRGIKRDLYEGGIRVPMIARWPGRIRPGQTSDFPWAFWDFLPTAAELAGASPPRGIDGISIVPTLLGRQQTNRHEYFYWEFHEGGSKQAVRLDDWKAVRLAPDQPLQLFNLAADLGETDDIAQANPAVVQRIEKLMNGARTSSEPWPLETAAQQKARAAASKANPTAVPAAPATAPDRAPAP